MNGPNPTPCPMWEEQLAALHPDDLSPLERKALKEHISSCSACEAVLADYYRMRSLIRSTFTPNRVPTIWKTFLPTPPIKGCKKPYQQRNHKKR